MAINLVRRQPNKETRSQGWFRGVGSTGLGHGWAPLVIGLVVASWLIAGVAAPVWAAPDEPAPLSGWELESKVRRVAEQVRCLVCQGQSIWDSQSGWSIQRRQEIRELLQAGYSEAEILDSFVDRWGTGVLMRPPLTGFFWTAWLLPGAVILVAGGGLAALLSRWRRSGGTEGGPTPQTTVQAGETGTAASSPAPAAASPPPTAKELAEIERRLEWLDED